MEKIIFEEKTDDLESIKQEEQAEYFLDFDFEESYFTQKELNIVKLKMIDVKKENKIVFQKQVKKEVRTRTRQKRKENKAKLKETMKNKLECMSKEERKKFFDEKKTIEVLTLEKLKNSLISPFKIIFDLDYDNLMKTREFKSLSSQLAYCHFLNKKLTHTFCYYITSYKNEAMVELEAMGSKNWYVNLFEDHFTELDIIKNTNKEVIYLSPDSSNVLDDINSNTLYIIGGFVDKPVSKNRSLYKANNLNIKTAKLPLDTYLKDLVNPVLNINTVVEIMGYYLESRSWELAIKKAIPNRMLNQQNLQK